MRRILFFFAVIVALIASLGSVSAWTHYYGSQPGGQWYYYNGYYPTYGTGYTYGGYYYGGYGYYPSGYYTGHAIPRNYHKYGYYNTYTYPSGHVYVGW